MAKPSVDRLLGHAFLHYMAIFQGLESIRSRTDHDGLTKGEKYMKLPGPDHPITIALNPRRVRVAAGGVVIADTSRALTLREASYPAVHYVPRVDADMTLLERTERTTHCPYKGDASYFSIKADGAALENAIWTYENPYPAMAEIAGYLAFYPNKVTIEELA